MIHKSSTKKVIKHKKSKLTKKKINNKKIGGGSAKKLKTLQQEKLQLEQEMQQLKHENNILTNTISDLNHKVRNLEMYNTLQKNLIKKIILNYLNIETSKRNDLKIMTFDLAKIFNNIDSKLTKINFDIYYTTGNADKQINLNVPLQTLENGDIEEIIINNMN